MSEALETEIDALGEALDAAWRRARETMTPRAVTRAEFIAHLRSKLDPGGGAEAVSELRAADLLVALGCVRSDEASLVYLDRQLLVRARVEVVRLGLSEDSADDVIQRVRIGLLLASRSAGPKLLAYDGRGPLVAWLRTVALHEALAQLRSRGARELSGELPDLASAAAPLDQQLVWRYHQEELKRAFSESLLDLTAQERTALKLRYVEGLSLEAIAAQTRQHRSTVVRALASLRAVLLEGTRRRLRERLQLESAELDSMLDQLGSSPHLSLERLLRRFGGRG